jgi:hypothetical protein
LEVAPGPVRGGACPWNRAAGRARLDREPPLRNIRAPIGAMWVSWLPYIFLTLFLIWAAVGAVVGSTRSASTGSVEWVLELGPMMALVAGAVLFGLAFVGMLTADAIGWSRPY